MGPGPLRRTADPLGELIVQHSQKSASGAVASNSINATKSGAPYVDPTRASGQNGTKLSGKTDVPPPAATDRLIIIALDPGHGGEDPGAVGPGGTREKDVVLRLALLMRERINATSVNGNTMRALPDTQRPTFLCHCRCGCKKRAGFRPTCL